MKLAAKLLAVFAALGLPESALALCVYHGKLYATTTLEQEFHDARWVARVRVVSAATWADGKGSGTIYRLKRIQTYKGNLPENFDFATERNSGGFYLDKGTKTDIGGEYLMFFVPNPRRTIGPPAARRALHVNYNCGQSRAWPEVPSSQRQQLVNLSRQLKS